MSYPATFTAQTRWIVNNKTALNIQFVSHLGDVVDTGDSPLAPWVNADTSMSLLDPAGVAYNLLPGNHDMVGGTTVQFDAHFGPSRFTGKHVVRRLLRAARQQGQLEHLRHRRAQVPGPEPGGPLLRRGADLGPVDHHGQPGP